jgi:branched-chain amino acid transport system ATP-binding protein
LTNIRFDVTLRSVGFTVLTRHLITNLLESVASIKIKGWIKRMVQTETVSTNKTVLQVENVSLSFGGVNALTGVTIDIKQDEILAIIGPNGAGKTSVLNCISGFYRPNSGRILFNGQDITKRPRHEMPSLGITRTFQNIQLYTGLTTVGNLTAARHMFFKHNWLEGAIFFGRARNEEVKHRAIVEDIIEFLDMEPIRNRVVGMLPYGQRKKIDLGRALALEPKILLLDEPMAGMNMEEKEDMARYILDTFELKKVPIVLVEHDMGVVMDLADRIVVLDFGKKIAEGTPSEIKHDARVIEAYLGREANSKRSASGAE